MAYAHPSDVEARLGRELDSSETTIVNTRLGDAELLIKSRAKDLDARIEAGSLDQALVVMVEAEMVLRLIKNPDGFVQESDGNYSYMISSAVASGRLELLPDEWALLGVSSGMFTIDPYLPNVAADYAPVVPYTVDKALRDGWA
jgi:hypothetical protein